MNILPREKQIEAVAALTEGVSVRATIMPLVFQRDNFWRLIPSLDDHDR
jgi:hypothetical protein